jgi:hypothetical protein
MSAFAWRSFSRCTSSRSGRSASTRSALIGLAASVGSRRGSCRGRSAGPLRGRATRSASASVRGERERTRATDRPSPPEGRLSAIYGAESAAAVAGSTDAGKLKRIAAERGLSPA